MLNINIEVESTQAHLQKRSGKKEKKSLKQYLLEKTRTWIDSVLEAERDEFLGRGRYAPLGEGHDNYRNGYRRRVLNFFGLGKIELNVPRDRKREFESAWLPERKGQDPETEAFLAEAFLAGLSTRDLARISEKHLRQKYDSKQISRIVALATAELEAWRQRPLTERQYKFLYIDGANFRVRINGSVSRQSFCAVLGVSEDSQCFEVLALEMGDRERVDLWESVFVSLTERGLNQRRWSWGSWMAYPDWKRSLSASFLGLRRSVARSMPKPTPVDGCGSKSGSSFPKISTRSFTLPAKVPPGWLSSVSKNSGVGCFPRPCR